MMFTADQFVAHLVGDYLTQSHWMATCKTKRFLPAAIHAVVYTATFLFLTWNPLALLVIGGTHFLIDRAIALPGSWSGRRTECADPSRRPAIQMRCHHGSPSGCSSSPTIHCTF